VFLATVALTTTTFLFSQDIEVKDLSPDDRMLSLTKEQYTSYRTTLPAQHPVYGLYDGIFYESKGGNAMKLFDIKGNADRGEWQ
jgi:hypothetical protein